MTMDSSTTWWIVAGVLVAAELGSTFYLLMLAIGAAAGAIAAHLGASGTTQALVAAAIGGGAVAAWHFGRSREATRPTASNPDVNLDVGERVHVAAWDDDGTARVQYRGAAWRARHAGPLPAQPGDHVIQEMRHNELLLRRAD